MFVFPSSCLSGLQHSLDLAKSVKTKHSIPTLYNFAVFRKVVTPVLMVDVFFGLAEFRNVLMM